MDPPNSSDDSQAPVVDQKELLPPVKPPSAAFVVQLFVIPLAIVAPIIAFGVAVHWLVNRGTDPDSLINDLAKGNAGSWQKAIDIAQMVHDSNNDELRKSEPLAAKLSEMLGNQIEEASLRDEQVRLRCWLCAALGVMEVGEGFDQLIRAAATERDIVEVEVRKTAIESIARRVDTQSVSASEAQANDELSKILMEASTISSDDPGKETLYGQLRHTVAFTLGVIGGQEFLDQLVVMLGDPIPAVRFNAATGLARYGDERCSNRLLEMLDLDSEVVDGQGNPVDANTRTIMLVNAVRSCSQLLAKNSKVEKAEQLRAAIKKAKTHESVGNAVRVMIENHFKE